MNNKAASPGSDWMHWGRLRCVLVFVKQNGPQDMFPKSWDYFFFFFFCDYSIKINSALYWMFIKLVIHDSMVDVSMRMPVVVIL